MGTDITFHQLRIFCAVAQAATLTRSGKQLGLAQPTLSQQLAKLEQSLGTKLFERALNQMVLTEAGRFLLRQAQIILDEIDQAQIGLGEFAKGLRGVIRLAGLNSIIRVVIPRAIARMANTHPALEFDIHETAPGETLDLLYGRSVNIGFIAANSVAERSLSFKKIPIIDDPYVFAVPRVLPLAGLNDPDAMLPLSDRKIINSCIQFNFGTQHTKRVAHWHQRVLPRRRLIAQCRSYEVALGMVKAGLGVCLVPALTAHDGHTGMAGIDLYATDQPGRQTVALVPAQYVRVEPYKTFLKALLDAGEEVRQPPILPTPPFIARAAEPRENAPLRV